MPSSQADPRGAPPAPRGRAAAAELCRQLLPAAPTDVPALTAGPVAHPALPLMSGGESALQGQWCLQSIAPAPSESDLEPAPAPSLVG